MAGENGTNLRLKLNGNVVAGKLSEEFAATMDEIEISDADDGATSAYVMGRDHIEITGEYNFNTTASNNSVSALWTARAAQTAVPFIFGGTDAGDWVITGNLFIRDLTVSAPDNERVTVSVSHRVTGAVTQTTYS